MMYVAFQCYTEHPDNPWPLPTRCGVMIRVPTGAVATTSKYCKWCQAGKAYYADASLWRSRQKERGQKAESTGLPR